MDTRHQSQLHLCLSLLIFFFPDNNLMEMKNGIPVSSTNQRLTSEKKEVLTELRFIFGQLLCHTAQQLGLHEITHGKIST